MRKQAIFLCPEHRFVTIVRAGEMSCEGTPGHRVSGCETCDAVVHEAFAYMEGVVESEVAG